MTPKAKKITGWVLTSMITLVFAGSAAMKFSGGEEVLKTFAALGLSQGTVQLIAIVEVVSILLFIIPRTGVLGTLLLAAYLGGAIATHLEHQSPVFIPVIVQVLVWITATIRFPELSSRLFGKANTVKHRVSSPTATFAHS